MFFLFQARDTLAMIILSLVVNKEKLFVSISEGCLIIYIIQNILMVQGSEFNTRRKKRAF